MNALTIASKEQFFQQLDEAFAEKIAKTEAKKISEFAKQHYAHIPLEELISRRFSDTYGAILAAWQFLQKRSAEETPVSVFNPDLESDGWQSTHTVIFILHPNMPFLIDSLRIAINQREIGTHSIQHSILQVERDTQGKLKKLHPPKKKSANASYEAFIVLEIDRHSSPEDLRSLEEVLQTILHEVRIAVSDFPIVTEKVNEISRELDNTTAGIDEEEKEEAKAFLAWLVKDHFTFLGYDEYDFAKDKSGLVVRRVENSELGILRVNNERPDRVRLNELPQRTRHEMTRTDDIFIFAKSAQRSRVHRPAYPDYIAVKKFNSKGEVVGERRFHVADFPAAADMLVDIVHPELDRSETGLGGKPYLVQQWLGPDRAGIQTECEGHVTGSSGLWVLAESSACFNTAGEVMLLARRFSSSGPRVKICYHHGATDQLCILST